MSDAVFSSNGRKLAYTKGRRVANIWRIKIPEPGQNPATWTNAEQITFDNAYIEFLDISKDGQELVFSSDRMGNQDIWRMPIDGGELQQLTTHPTPDWDPAFSPDGRQIVFYAYRSGNRDIWTMPVSGGTPKQLTTNEEDDSLPNWTPDGENISYSSSRDGFNLWLISAQGGAPTRLTSFFSDIARWSPEGQRIAIRGVHQGSYGWWLQSTTSGDMEPIQDTGNVRMVFWAPDGKRLYMVIGAVQKDFESRVGVDFWELTLERGEKRRLTDFAGRYGQLLSGVFAPDGPYLYFNWREDTGDLWVMDVEEPE